MQLKGDRLPLGRDAGRSNPWRILVYLVLIVGGVMLTRLVEAGRVRPLFLPTPGPTRSARSYAEEAEAHFSAGDLEKAIEAYKVAASLEPGNPDLWAELARIQTYSSDLRTTLDQRRARLTKARESIEQAVLSDPDNSKAHAVRALVYDWSAAAEVKDSIGIGDSVRVQATIESGGGITARLIELTESGLPEEVADTEETETTVLFSGTVETIQVDVWVISGRTVMIDRLRTVIRDRNKREEFLAEAEDSALRASQLDPGNSLALAYYAEVLVDQQRSAQALDLAQTAAQDLNSEDPKDQMDIHRVYGTVLESQGQYLQAILEYQEAAKLSPNLTFLYLRIGANYRQLRDIETALDYFDRAARINQQLDIKDPTPYLAIGRTYQQQGEFFIAAVNIESALAIDPANPDIYARLGIVYFQARNYESAIPVLKCALDGCSVEESGVLLCDLGVLPCDEAGEMALQVGEEVIPIGLEQGSVEYYYTYGSVLSAYAGTEEFPNACVDAERIFRQLDAKYRDDPIVSAIVAEGRAICAGESEGPPPEVTPTPSSTDSP
jgi:tetratricopeptide (TPR) repeat protein